MNEKIEGVKIIFTNNKQDLYEAINMDYKTYGIKFIYNEIESIIDKMQNEKCEISNKTILVIYNGNPYITFELILKAMINVNNIILTSDNKEFYTTAKIISIMQEFFKNENIILKFYKEIDLNNVLREESLIDKIIYFGDKRNYRALKSKTNIQTVYNGYGSIIVYVDDEDEFENYLSEIEEYAYLNEFAIYKHTDDVDEAVETINKDGKNYICIILSNSEEKINKFKAKINSTHILANSINLDGLKPEIPNDYFV